MGLGIPNGLVLPLGFGLNTLFEGLNLNDSFLSSLASLAILAF